MGATACVSKTSAGQNWQSGKRTLTFDASIVRLCLKDVYQSHMCTVINGLTTRRGVGDGAKNMDDHDSKERFCFGLQLLPQSKLYNLYILFLA